MVTSGQWGEVGVEGVVAVVRVGWGGGVSFENKCDNVGCTDFRTENSSVINRKSRSDPG